MTKPSDIPLHQDHKDYGDDGHRLFVGSAHLRGKGSASDCGVGRRAVVLENRADDLLMTLGSGAAGMILCSSVTRRETRSLLLLL